MARRPSVEGGVLVAHPPKPRNCAVRAGDPLATGDHHQHTARGRDYASGAFRVGRTAYRSPATSTSNVPAASQALVTGASCRT